MLKGDEVIDLGFLVLVASILLGTFLIIVEVTAFQIKVGISTNVNALVETNYEGSALVSLLNAKNGDLTNAEILGTLASADSDAEKGIISSLESMDVSMAVKENNVVIKEYGDVVDDNVNAEIAMPGGRKGRLEIS